MLTSTFIRGRKSNIDQFAFPIFFNVFKCFFLLQHWSTWKRNIFRTFVVALSFGVAYVCRDYYAYVAAMSGSIGSSLLAFVLPCCFHFILKKYDLSTFIVAKDILLILFGIIAGIVGFATTLIKIIEP